MHFDQLTRRGTGDPHAQQVLPSPATCAAACPLSIPHIPNSTPTLHAKGEDQVLRVKQLPRQLAALLCCLFFHPHAAPGAGHQRHEIKCVHWPAKAVLTQMYGQNTEAHHLPASIATAAACCRRLGSATGAGPRSCICRGSSSPCLALALAALPPFLAASSICCRCCRLDALLLLLCERLQGGVKLGAALGVGQQQADAAEE